MSLFVAQRGGSDKPVREVHSEAPECLSGVAFLTCFAARLRLSSTLAFWVPPHPAKQHTHTHDLRSDVTLLTFFPHSLPYCVFLICFPGSVTYLCVYLLY